MHNARDGNSQIDVIAHCCTGTFPVQDLNVSFEMVTPICGDDSRPDEKCSGFDSRDAIKRARRENKRFGRV